MRVSLKYVIADNSFHLKQVIWFEVVKMILPNTVSEQSMVVISVDQQCTPEKEMGQCLALNLNRSIQM